jgi:endoglucanase
MKPVLFTFVFLFTLPSLHSQTFWNDSVFVHQNGTQILDGNNNPVSLEGVNLGGWLLWEGWIWGGGYTQEKTIFNRMETIAGTPQANAFRDSVHQKFITRKDLELISQHCFNIVRIPFNHSILEDDSNPFIYKPEGWMLLDSVLKWCEDYDVYALLDLHSTPGGQSNSFTADPDLNNLWDLQINKDRTASLWKAIADRYKNRGIIAGYDLINEPNAPNDSDLVHLYDVIIDSIRTVDNNHMLFLEGNAFATDFSMFTSLPDNNMAFQFHFYTWLLFGPLGSHLMPYTNLSTALTVPIWCGEWGENNYPELDTTHLLLKDPLYNINGSAVWTWKKSKKDGQYPFYNGIDTTGNWQKSITWISNIFAPQPTVVEMQNGINEFLNNIEILNTEYNSTIDLYLGNCGEISIDDAVSYDFQVYPNPFADQFQIQFNKELSYVDIQLFDQTGQAIMQITSVQADHVMVKKK